MTLPNSLIKIYESAFQDCKSIKNVTIPTSVTYIGGWAFANCGLDFVKVESGNPIYDSRDNCNAIIETESNKLLVGCNHSVIPDGVTAIGPYAFSYCSELSEISIPNSVTEIGDYAFSNCNFIGLKCYAKEVPNASANAFYGSYPNSHYLCVPSESLEDYKNTAPWNEFGSIEALAIEKCAKPTINYANKLLTFSCPTDGVIFHSNISDSDINNYESSEISLSATYEISVYVTKQDYEDSDVTTATLVWIDAIFTADNPTPSTSAKTISQTIPLLISTNGGTITVNSHEGEGQVVNVYTIDGKALGSSTIRNGNASIQTSLTNGDPFVVKVGTKSVKLKMK